jgi:preprotein translocase subunit SecA
MSVDWPLSVESSETLARMLKRAKIPHSVLNAKFHEQEAEIVALAGQRGAVTVSTNMAGRGTDIKLGAGVAELGGLFVIGTERHQSRRVDRQLRGRCARQDDPGRSQFFISLEDDLIRKHAASDRMTTMLEYADTLDVKTLKNSSLGKFVETAQRQVEQRDYKQRKRVLDFDDVMNMQREIVYGYRNEVLTTEDTRKLVHEVISEIVSARVNQHLSECDPYDSDFKPLLQWFHATLPISVGHEDLINQSGETISTMIVEKVRYAYESGVSGLPLEVMDQAERHMILNAIDRQWQEHLNDMDELREGVYLRAQGQKDPLVEYKNEACDLFVILMDAIKQESLQNLFRSSSSLEAFLAQLHRQSQVSAHDEDTHVRDKAERSGIPDAAVQSATGKTLKLNLPERKTVSHSDVPGRNSPCTCGSGKKYKQCCGRVT